MGQAENEVHPADGIENILRTVVEYRTKLLTMRQQNPAQYDKEFKKNLPINFLNLLQSFGSELVQVVDGFLEITDDILDRLDSGALPDEVDEDLLVEIEALKAVMDAAFAQADPPETLKNALTVLRAGRLLPELLEKLEEHEGDIDDITGGEENEPSEEIVKAEAKAEVPTVETPKEGVANANEAPTADGTAAACEPSGE